jgi:hypothetical protein
MAESAPHNPRSRRPRLRAGLSALRAEEERIGALAERGEGAAERLERRDPFWPAQLTALLAILLYITLPEKLTVGPAWLIPALEGILFVGLIVAMPNPGMQYSPRRRHLAMALTGLVSLANLIALILLAHFLVKGGKAGGRELISSGIVVWITNVLIFALWFWELDRGGPVTRALDPDATPDFLFPQMSEPRWAQEKDSWRPRFVDYLYVSLTNATAFSPTDTMPLSPIAKVLMGVQGVASLLTIGLIVARAVNILG